MVLAAFTAMTLSQGLALSLFLIISASAGSYLVGIEFEIGMKVLNDMVKCWQCLVGRSFNFG